jgi:uncharacterized protein YjbI with pentapeptide repeats
MRTESHLEVLMQGASAWNAWRAANSSLQPKLRNADLTGADLRGFDLCFLGGFGGGVDLRGARLNKAELTAVDLRCADLSGATLEYANLQGANLSGTDLAGAILGHADLSNAQLGDFVGADLRDATLHGVRAASVDGSYADLSRANLCGAVFRNVDLQNARLNSANVDGATFSDCRVFGIAAWDLKGKPAKQSGLFVTPIWADLRPPTARDMSIREEQYESALTMDSLELAPLVFSLIQRDRFGDLINTLTSKVILILGRFSTERKLVLDAIRERLAEKRYLPVVFDFAAPWQRDLTETISALAHLSRFVVADLTAAKSIPQELSAIVPSLPSVPVVPILEQSEREPYSMFEHFRRYPWVLTQMQYADVNDLVARLAEDVIQPAESYLNQERGRLNAR